MGAIRMEASTSLGLGITAATLALLVAGYFRSRKRRAFPGYGWLGLIALAGAEVLMFRGIEPVATYFTPIAWSAYILVADAAVLSLTNRSRLNDAPVVVARLALLSIPLWLIFEAYNLRLQNWTYVGVPTPLWESMLGYGWSFATITPAIFETSDLVQGILPPLPSVGWTIPRAAENVLIGCGALFLALPLILPRRIAAYLFALVWVGFLLLLDPINRRLRLPSFSGIFQRDFAGGHAGSSCRDGSVGGSGSSGITGRQRNGTTHFRCFRRPRFSRCRRRDSSGFCRLPWNVSQCM